MEHGIKDLNVASDYAPKRKVDLTEIEKAMAEPAPKTYERYNYNSNNEAISTIKDSIKKLTHRQMRDMVNSIFEARDKVGGVETGNAIDKNAMADVLDRFAHGD